MKFSDLLELTLQRFKTRALRVFLTMFGIGMGIGIVYFLVSFGFGIQELVIGRIATSDSLLALEVVPIGDNDSIQLSKENMAKITDLNNIEESSPLISRELQIKANGITSQTMVQGVKNNYFRLAGIENLKGEVFSDKDDKSIIVSNAVLKLFNLDESSAIGKEITIVNSDKAETKDEKDNKAKSDSKQLEYFNEKKMKITGILEDQNNMVYMNITNFPEQDISYYDSARFKVKTKEQVESTKSQIQELGFEVSALTDTLDQLNKIFSVTQAMFAAFGIVALFISAVGMFNTMTISLLERTREIGIMKSIGATQWDIWQMFLFEAIIMGFLGGLVGLAIGFASTSIINFLINRVANAFGGETVSMFVTPLWFLITILLFSLVVGFLTGLFPARRASRINPLQALRYE